MKICHKCGSVYSIKPPINYCPICKVQKLEREVEKLYSDIRKYIVAGRSVFNPVTETKTKDSDKEVDPERIVDR